MSNLKRYKIFKKENFYLAALIKTCDYVAEGFANGTLDKRLNLNEKKRALLRQMIDQGEFASSVKDWNLYYKNNEGYIKFKLDGNSKWMREIIAGDGSDGKPVFVDIIPAFEVLNEADIYEATCEGYDFKNVFCLEAEGISKLICYNNENFE